MTATMAIVREPSSLESAPSPRMRWRSPILLACVLVLSGVAIVHGIHTGEFSFNVDETQHAVTGLFVSDLIRDHPLAHPVDYTYQYYAQYPALAGVIHWPPLFYFFEGLSFLVLGPTVIAARISILLFALLGLGFWYRLVEELQDEWTAALSTLLLALLPTILLFEKTVMLEIPSMSLCLAATYFWIRYLREGLPRHIYWFAGFSSAALLTKQNSVYLVLFCLFSVTALRKWTLMLNRHVLAAFAICVACVGPFYALVYVVHWKTIAMDVGDTQFSGIRKLLFYWQTLPGQLGWALLGLSALGLATSRRWERWPNVVLMLSWIASCYVTFTVIGLKESRYVIYWLPPFVYFAAGLLTRMFRDRRLQIVAAAAAIVLVAASLISAWRFQRPYVAGYESAARGIVETTPSAIILYDGDLPGNFIFFMRADSRERRFLILRKALYAYRIKQRGGAVEMAHSREEVAEIIRSLGVRLVVVSDGMRLAFNSQRELRELLQTAQFKLLGRYPLYDSNSAAPPGNLLVYENMNWAPPTEKFLRVKMLTLGHDIVVPMDQFGFVDGGRTAEGKP